MKRLGEASGKIEIPEDKKAEGYVVTGSVVAFTEELSGQDKVDVLNTLLIAQLAADVKFKEKLRQKTGMPTKSTGKPWLCHPRISIQ